MMKPVDLTKLLKKYTSGWVALSKDYKRVVAAAESLEELDGRLKKLRNPKVVLISAAPNYRSFIT
ncbi:MAG: hypothetical protein HYU80_01560 [Candidatus Blackburnbacteria bacterium]|nr:hypothetical protein [Candidatus Blackburnbacteria bacterium]